MESSSKRRRFQASITNFFDSHSDDEAASRNTNAPSSSSSSSSSTSFPSLPPSTQSSLLTVGCRIRKSVPEGYKTHATASGGFTPRPFMNARLSPATLAAITAPVCYSELTPYAASSSESSIHDIGGLPAIQSLATATFCGIRLHQMPPSSSPSSSHASTNRNKRAFDDSLSSSSEDDDVDADFIPQLPPSVFSSYLPSPYYHSDPSATPFTSHHRRGSSYPFKHTTMPDLNAFSASMQTNPAFRKFAQPKSRVKTYPPPPASPEQENFGFFGGCGYAMNLESHSSDMDFGEAGFLRRRDEVEMDCS